MVRATAVSAGLGGGRHGARDGNLDGMQCPCLQHGVFATFPVQGAADFTTAGDVANGESRTHSRPNFAPSPLVMPSGNLTLVIYIHLSCTLVFMFPL